MSCPLVQKHQRTNHTHTLHTYMLTAVVTIGKWQVFCTGTTSRVSSMVSQTRKTEKGALLAQSGKLKLGMQHKFGSWLLLEMKPKALVVLRLLAARGGSLLTGQGRARSCKERLPFYSKWAIALHKIWNWHLWKMKTDALFSLFAANGCRLAASRHFRQTSWGLGTADFIFMAFYIHVLRIELSL